MFNRNIRCIEIKRKIENFSKKTGSTETLDVLKSSPVQKVVVMKGSSTETLDVLK